MRQLICVQAAHCDSPDVGCFIQIYPVSEGYLRKIPVSRTVKCPSPLKRLGIFASPLNRYFSQVTLTNRIYLYKTLYPIIDEKNKWRKDFGTMHVMRLYLIVSSSLVKQILAVSLNNWLWTYNWYRVAVENRHPLLKQVPTDNRFRFITGTRWQQNAIPVAKACTHC